MSIEQLLSSTKNQLYYKECIIKDTTNNISASIYYNPDFNNSYTGMIGRNTLGWFKSKK